MRMPTDLPRRRRPRIGSRGRIGLVILAVALFVLLTSLRGIAGFYTDYLWFDSLGFSDVFRGVLGAKVVLGLIFTGVFFVLLWVNLLIADRLAPRFRPAGPEEEVIERYRELIGNRTGLVRTAVAALFAVIAGAGVSGQWNSWLLFTNARDVGVDDPQFNVDVGFYLFRLPFLSYVVDWAFASVVIVLIVTAVAHYLNGGIRVSGPGQRATPAVKGHLSVLLGVLAVLRAASYWLGRYELTFSTRGVVDGATYTDVKAQLPALNLLFLISLAAVVLLIVNIWRRGWVLPVLALGLWAFTAVVVGGIYPAIVQRFSVEPAESSKERPYISRNIQATRTALGLGNVETVPFVPTEGVDPQALERNAGTVRNIRLWDPAVVRDTFQRLQERQTYYAIRDVDVDRYSIGGQPTQVVLSARELETSQVPQGSWEARHLAYTSGYGLVLSPSNSVTASGVPDLLVRDIPLRTVPELPVDQPNIYVGEGLSEYVITDTRRAEIEYQAEDRVETGSYTGRDGVGIGSLYRKLAFALRFGDINPVISGNLRESSKILYLRDVRERVETLAPFLRFDADPYPVVLDGRMKYVLDAYTTSSRYPYAQGANTEQLPDNSGLNHGFNYVRNSVKAVVDAYDGDVRFYVIDEQDPLLGAYRDAFPDLFTDADQVPEGLRAHFRYPEDLFRVQTNMWGRYHLDDPDDFYNQSGAWSVAQDPGTAVSPATSQQLDPQTDQPLGPPREARIDPYYQMLRLPGQPDEDFLILRPFVPFSRDDQQQVLTAFMVAKSDPDNYGQLQTFQLPSSNPPPGPRLVGSAIRADAGVSQQETLLGNQGSGSRVVYGNLLLIPLEQTLLYVQPFYVEAEGNQIPLLERVIVFYQGQVVIRDTLQESLAEIFGSAPPTLEEPGAPPPDGSPTAPTTPAEPTDDTVADLLSQADQALTDAAAALAAGDLGEYQDKVDEAADLIRRARELEGGTADGATTTTTQPASA